MIKFKGLAKLIYIKIAKTILFHMQILSSTRLIMQLWDQQFDQTPYDRLVKGTDNQLVTQSSQNPQPLTSANTEAGGVWAEKFW